MGEEQGAPSTARVDVETSMSTAATAGDKQQDLQHHLHSIQAPTLGGIKGPALQQRSLTQHSPEEHQQTLAQPMAATAEDNKLLPDQRQHVQHEHTAVTAEQFRQAMVEQGQTFTTQLQHHHGTHAMCHNQHHSVPWQVQCSAYLPTGMQPTKATTSATQSYTNYHHTIHRSTDGTTVPSQHLNR